jgi:CheY-like chemotaxis protein
MARRRIFIVEDDDLDVQLMRQVLGEVDADIEFAGDAESALRRLSGQHANGCDPDLVILDIELPGESGIWMLRRLRRSALRSVPVIMMTGSESLLQREEAESLGIAAYVSKPLELAGYARLIEVTKRLLSGGSDANGLTALR